MHTPTTQPQYTDEGLRVLLAEDWCIYVVNESDSLIYYYNTELWQEWLDYDDQAPNAIWQMIKHAHKYTPYPMAKMTCDYCEARGNHDHMTIEDWSIDHAS